MSTDLEMKQSGNTTETTPVLVSTRTIDKVDGLVDVGDAAYADFLTGWKLRVVTLTLALGMFLVGVDSSIIGVVTPRSKRPHLKSCKKYANMLPVPLVTTAFQSMDDIAWYGSGYMLPHTVLQPTLASFYKAFHPTYVYFVSALVFERKRD